MARHLFSNHLSHAPLTASLAPARHKQQTLNTFKLLFQGSAHAADSHHWFPLISIGVQGFPLFFKDFHSFR